MRRIGKRFAAPLFALVFAASMLFGVSTGLAQPAKVQACANNAGTGEIAVACSVRRDCIEPCGLKYGPSSGAACFDGCCYCSF